MRKPIVLWLALACLPAGAVKINVAKNTGSPLNFGEAVQGDLAQLIAPGNTETSSNASFTITGDANAAYNFTLPPSATMAGSGPSIEVTDFTAATATGSFNLGVAGSQVVFVGATRAAIPIGQVAGNYTVAFNVYAQYASGGTTDSANHNAKVSVIKVLQISKVSNLNFGSAPQGDPLKAIPPGSSENAQNASFTITGEDSHTYNVQLPVSTLMSGPSGATILVDGFASNTANGSYLLNASGTQKLFVGATRAALNISQPIGAYVGTFTITVVY